MGAHSIGKKQQMNANNVLGGGKTNAKSTLRQGSNGAMAMRDRRDRMLSVGPNGLSHAMVGQMQGGELPRGEGAANKGSVLPSNQTGHNTEKIKKNGRKLNSGVPAKILIGRNGPNIVIQGNQQQAQMQ